MSVCCWRMNMKFPWSSTARAAAAPACSAGVLAASPAASPRWPGYCAARPRDAALRPGPDDVLPAGKVEGQDPGQRAKVRHGGLVGPPPRIRHAALLFLEGPQRLRGAAHGPPHALGPAEVRRLAVIVITWGEGLADCGRGGGR